MFRPFPSLFQCCSRSKQPKDILFPPDTAYHHAPRMSRPTRFFPHQKAYVPGVLSHSLYSSSPREESTGFIRSPPRLSLNDFSTQSLSGATIVDVDIPRHRHFRPGQLAADKEIGDSSPHSTLSAAIYDPSDNKPSTGVSTSSVVVPELLNVRTQQSGRSLSAPPTLLEEVKDVEDIPAESPSGKIVGTSAWADESEVIRADPKELDEEASWEEFWKTVRDRAAHGQ